MSTTSQPPPAGTIHPEAIERYLRERVSRHVRLLALNPFGTDDALGLKAHGYGRPLLVRWEEQSEEGPLIKHAVLHTMGPDRYGHDRRADRIAALAEAAVDYRAIPHHVRPLGVGTFDGRGELVPLPPGEPWLLTEYVEGRTYAVDLDAIAARTIAPTHDIERAITLADYLAMLHAQPKKPIDHTRHVRDTLGSGEGIFGIADGWPAEHPVTDPERLMRIEQQVVAWRWRLKANAHRARRIHGDFHPFNILFREGNDFSVLDASRRVAGDPADDVTCLAVNYLFFALRARGAFKGALRDLWHAFWERYLEASGDMKLLELVAPWFTWRVLVVASPAWYPDVPDAVRLRLLDFVEGLLAGAPFDPFTIGDLS